MVAVMDACLGSRKCGKSCAFTIFQQPFFLFFDIKFPEISTMKGCESAERAKSPRMPVMKDFSSKLMTFPTIHLRVKG